MKLMRAATLSVADLDRSVELYTEWLDYSVAEQGTLAPELAASWGSEISAGQRFAVLRPASGRDVFIRLVENRIHPDYRALRTFGWAAIEICVQDVLKVNERMLASPFEVIGPPNKIAGLDAIYPMQVQGPDQEILYFTQISDDLPDFDLPRAESMIDRLFILVMACSDTKHSAAWLSEHIKIGSAGDDMEIVYTMIARAFDMPLDSLHRIATMAHEKDVFMELDNLPAQATVRPRFADELPQGVAIGTFWHPQFDAIDTHCKDVWIRPPEIRTSCIYGGKRSATLRAPDGTLIEIVDG